MARQEQWNDWEDDGTGALPRSRMSRNRRPPPGGRRSHPQRKLFLARRVLHIEDEQKVDRVMKLAVAVCPERPLVPYSGPKQGYTVSLLPPRSAFSIFQKYFLGSEGPQDPTVFRGHLDRFNATVANFVQYTDRENPSTAYAGRIAVLKTEKPYVVLSLTDAEGSSGAQQMRRQKFTLYSDLTSARRFSRHQAQSPNFPNLTLAQFVRLESAYAFQAAFEEQAAELFAAPLTIEPVRVKKINLPPYFQ